MTPKQRKFCDEYIKTGNATQSAINAGYSQKTAKSIGAENLTKPDLKKYIDSKLKDISNNAIRNLQTLCAFYFYFTIDVLISL